MGHSIDWIHDGKRVPAVPALRMFARWRSVQPVDPDRASGDDRGQGAARGLSGLHPSLRGKERRHPQDPAVLWTSQRGKMRATVRNYDSRTSIHQGTIIYNLSPSTLPSALFALFVHYFHCLVHYFNCLVHGLYFHLYKVFDNICLVWRFLIYLPSQYFTLPCVAITQLTCIKSLALSLIPHCYWPITVASQTPNAF